MNTIGWKVERDGFTSFFALHGDTALVAQSETPDDVWQFRHLVGQVEAIALLVDSTAENERDGGKVGEPVQFDLSPAAIAEICKEDSYMHWYLAPNLRDELMAAVKFPWTGPVTGLAPLSEDWVSVGLVEKGVGF